MRCSALTATQGSTAAAARRCAAPIVARAPSRQRAVAVNAHAAPPPSTPAAPTAAAAGKKAVPRSIHEVDPSTILGFGADLSADHPGFHDDEYKRRRVMIANLAREYKMGDPIPRIEYTEQEVAAWGHVLRELKQLFPHHACKQFLHTLPMLNFKEDEIPQLQDMSEVLSQATGWKIRPVAGLLHPREFLAGLAYRTFHSTQYMRHHSKPSYTPEPDVCHELIGHVPMLADPSYAALMQSIGEASLGADDKMIWHLTKCYWYTVEFGLVMEDGVPKAFGAGVLSSFGELEHMASGRAALKPFDPFAPQPKMSYKDGYQKSYFVLESFEDASAKMRALAETIAVHGHLPEHLRGNPTMA